MTPTANPLDWKDHNKNYSRQFQDLLKPFIMINIKKLVYFDLEAKGLKSARRPRISEITFVAMNFADDEELHTKIQNQLRNT